MFLKPILITLPKFKYILLLSLLCRIYISLLEAESAGNNTFLEINLIFRYILSFISRWMELSNCKLRTNNCEKNDVTFAIATARNSSYEM
jgi:hypothetical protein